MSRVTFTAWLAVVTAGCATSGGGASRDGGVDASFTLTTTVHAVATNPLWAAWQDGDSAFVTVRGTDGVHRFTPREAVFTVAVACAGDGVTRATLFLQHLLRGERRSLTRVCSAPTQPTEHVLSIDVRTLAADKVALGAVFDGVRSQAAGAGASLAWTVVAGMYDVALAVAAGEGAPIERVALSRDVEVRGPRSVLFEAATAAVAPRDRMFEAAAPTAGESLSLQASLWTARGTVLPLASGGGAVGRTATLMYPRLPDELARSGDVYVLQAQALTQAAIHYTASAAPQSAAFDARFSGRPAVTRMAGASLGLRVDFFAPVPNALDYTLRVSTRAARWVASFSAAWLASRNEPTAYSLPSLIDAPPELRVPGDANVEWAFEARLSNRDAAETYLLLESPVPTAGVDGLVLQLAQQKGFSTP